MSCHVCGNEGSFSMWNFCVKWTFDGSRGPSGKLEYGFQVLVVFRLKLEKQACVTWLHTFCKVLWCMDTWIEVAKVW